MSKNDEEYGEIRLPSAAVADVRRALAEADMAVKVEAFDLTQEVWSKLSPKARRDRGAYELETRKVLSQMSPEWGYDRDTSVYEEAHSLLWCSPGSRPRRVLRKDVQWPTNRTTTFELPDGHVSLDRGKSTLTWSAEGNHGVERARSSRVGRALFTALGRVRWTSGTGGVISGNDEYNREDRAVGGGGNYVTGAFGPIGAQQHPWGFEDYTDSRGRRVSVRSVATSGRAGRVGRGVPQGGQFTTAWRGESSVRL